MLHTFFLLARIIDDKKNQIKAVITARIIIKSILFFMRFILLWRKYDLTGFAWPMMVNPGDCGYIYMFEFYLAVFIKQADFNLFRYSKFSRS